MVDVRAGRQEQRRRLPGELQNLPLVRQQVSDRTLYAQLVQLSWFLRAHGQRLLGLTQRGQGQFGARVLQ